MSRSGRPLARAERAAARQSKLADEELRLLRRGGTETVSVIVELDLPRPRVEVGESEWGGVGGRRPRRVEPESEEQQQDASETIAGAQVLLERLLGTPPVWLAAARAFGVEASGDQLDAITRSPLVRRVYLNRLRR